MKKATYIYKGENIDFTNTTATTIEFGTVVKLATRVGIAAAPIQPGECGSLATEGVFAMAKGNTEAITLGASLYYDTANDVVTATAAANTPVGWATAAAATGDLTVAVKLMG